MTTAELVARSRAARREVDAALDRAEQAADDLAVAVARSNTLPSAARSELEAILDRATGQRATVLRMLLESAQ
jgi:hypothetical protein